MANTRTEMPSFGDMSCTYSAQVSGHLSSQMWYEHAWLILYTQLTVFPISPTSQIEANSLVRAEEGKNTIDDLRQVCTQGGNFIAKIVGKYYDVPQFFLGASYP